MLTVVAPRTAEIGLRWRSAPIVAWRAARVDPMLALREDG